MKNKLFTRIEKLFDVGALRKAKVLVAGCGSGGGMVALQLAMSGIAKLYLLIMTRLNRRTSFDMYAVFATSGKKK